MTKTTLVEKKLHETGCCPRFEPDSWDEQEVVWQNKLFVRDHIRSVWHMPLNFGRVMARLQKKIEAAGADTDEYLALNDETSRWRSDVYVAVSKEVPDAEMTRISGTFLTKVFEGPFSEMGRWMEEMQKFVRAQGKIASRYYFFYTTCPACAKEYGKNYVVIFAKVR